MTVVELYENGVINYLLKNGMLSPSVSSYIEYFIKFSSYRQSGKTYRESVALLSEEYRVSTTTIKKGIRLVKDSIN